MDADVDDATLLHAVACGDERALAELYDRHAGWLLVRMTRRCGSADIVDQALQDTFLALWQHARRYAGRGEVGAFIWGIGIRRLVDTLRREGGQSRVARLLRRSAEREELVRSAEDEVLLGVEHGPAGEALLRLSPELRAALQATVLDGLSCAEAARLLGVPEGTLKSRCHRARAQLREELT